ncbi:T9SS type A sorting domain-containing protein [Hymenobacter armeniacus]|uniref:T9SS type A sorting domain-containing protein n=1 Tax=Hymenobacter armeniacus TaxID=2771358 RepID=A0ABR8JZE8_9BACT|nr:T9SS type A sorting domain-containing protein [Hymenobacter armeniacus]MBD2724276.1 T9SS type A sorting domain-containing protein [Hymenobacter armeniacus]
MPHPYAWFRLLLLLLLGSTSATWAQRPPTTLVYDSLGRPRRLNHQLSVTFDRSVINLAAVGNPLGNEGPLTVFLTPAAINALQARFSFDVSNIYAAKMYSRVTPTDTLFFSGSPLFGPDWCVLRLYMPAGTDDHASFEAFAQQPLTLVKGVGFIIPAVPTSSSATPFLMASGNASLLTYPQPAQTVLTFALPAPLPATADVTILTAAGKVVRTEKHQVYQRGELTPLQTDLSALPAGQYFYRVVTPKATYQGRLEKQD